MCLKKRKWLIFSVLMFTMAGLSFVGYLRCSNVLQSQKAAQTWAGEHEMEFVQISCFLPANDPLTRNDIYDFREKVSAELAQVSLDDSLVCDAWSVETNVTVSTETKEFQTFATAVGGDFFLFHPLKLLNGSYLSEQDLMHDRVVLDRELAWKLFGGTDLAGMTILVNGQLFQIAGVVERDQDRGSAVAFAEETGMYLFCDALPEIEEQGINCYEIIFPEPVEKFGISLVEDNLHHGEGVITQNTGRYSITSLFSRLLSFGTWSMQHTAVDFPYWENTARYYQDWCALFVLMTSMFSVLPVITAVVYLIRACRYLASFAQKKLFSSIESTREYGTEKQGNSTVNITF